MKNSSSVAGLNEVRALLDATLRCAL